MIHNTIIKARPLITLNRSKLDTRIKHYVPTLIAALIVSLNHIIINLTNSSDLFQQTYLYFYWECMIIIVSRVLLPIYYNFRKSNLVKDGESLREVLNTVFGYRIGSALYSFLISEYYKDISKITSVVILVIHIIFILIINKTYLQLEMISLLYKDIITNTIVVSAALSSISFILKIIDLYSIKRIEKGISEEAVIKESAHLCSNYLIMLTPIIWSYIVTYVTNTKATIVIMTLFFSLVANMNIGLSLIYDMSKRGYNNLKEVRFYIAILFKVVEILIIINCYYSYNSVMESEKIKFILASILSISFICTVIAKLIGHDTPIASKREYILQVLMFISTIVFLRMSFYIRDLFNLQTIPTNYLFYALTGSGTETHNMSFAYSMFLMALIGSSLGSIITGYNREITGTYFGVIINRLKELKSKKRYSL